MDIESEMQDVQSLRWYQLEPDDAKELVFKMVLFVICPFAAFLGSLLRPTSKSSFVIYFLFGVLFCWHLDTPGLATYDDYIGVCNDFVRHKYTMADLLEKFVGYITFQGKEKEIYSVFLNAVTRVFSNNYHLFFAIASIPYLAFSLLSVRKLVSDIKYPTYGMMALLIILLFVIPRDIVTVQNPRYTTAVWLTMWGFLNYFDRTNRHWFVYLVPILFAPLIHSGFWPMIFVFFIANFMSLSVRKIEILFFLSLPFSLFSYELFSGFNYSFLPPVFSHWVESYLNEKTYEKWILHKGTSGFFWVQQMFDYIKYALYLYIPIMLMKHRDEILSREDIGKLYPFYILLFSVVNFIRLLPTIGERYLWTVQILSIYFLFKVFYPLKKKYFYVLLGGWSFYIFMRWFYKGAGVYLVQKNIYIDNLFSLINDFLS